MWAAVSGLFVFLGILVTNVFTLIGQRDAARQRREAAAEAKEVARKVEVAAEATKLVAAKTDLVAAKADLSALAQSTASKNMVIMLQEIKSTGKDIHTLVNSRLGIVLMQNAQALRALADLNPNSLKHELLAIDAEKVSKEHASMQAIVDAGKDAEAVSKPV
jgi:hypothetical protein